MIDEDGEEMEEIIKRVYAGKCFRLSRMFLHIMSPREAIVLAELINELGAKKAYSDDDWFTYSVDEMTKSIRLSSNSQRRTIGKLRDANWIDCKQRGMPARRNFRINFEMIDKELSKVSMRIRR